MKKGWYSLIIVILTTHTGNAMKCIIAGTAIAITFHTFKPTVRNYSIAVTFTKNTISTILTHLIILSPSVLDIESYYFHSVKSKSNIIFAACSLLNAVRTVHAFIPAIVPSIYSWYLFISFVYYLFID